MQTDVLVELLYADDIDKRASSEANAVLETLNQSHNHATMLHHPARTKHYSRNGGLKVVDKCTYLGSSFSRGAQI